MIQHNTDTVVIGAGIAGIATAYYLSAQKKKCDVIIVDPLQAMSFTSAQSGENYRNWWPHPTMVEFTNHSTGLMEKIARDSDNCLQMNRRGYALATRLKKIDELIADLYNGYSENAEAMIRVHESASTNLYQPPLSADWQNAPDGVDVLRNRDLIRRTFPTFSPDIANVIHIRRAGDISGQQLGNYMLQAVRAGGGKLLHGEVCDIVHNGHFQLALDNGERIYAETLVNAAGPFVDRIATMLGITLPIENVLQQKIAFEDREKVIPRDMPFSIDLDARRLNWTNDERELLAEDPHTAWLTKPIHGGIHCRPDGGDHGNWVKLGWAYNHASSEALWEPDFDPHFPEIVLRGATALNPALKVYYDQMPAHLSHYGGYYTMTEENWPLIGPMGVDGAFVVGALSGFGTMAACAAGSLCASWMTGADLPGYASDLSMARYHDRSLMDTLKNAASRGVL
jgi:glycine/D-amino acid oxidase-like deaminating enzyme